MSTAVAHRAAGALVLTALAAGACKAPSRGANEPAATAAAAAEWAPPPESAIPTDSLGASIRRGLALFNNTKDSLPQYATGGLSCRNCHLDAGRNPTAAPVTASHARFPKYMERTGAVIGLADRVNYCFTRSLAGRKLPVESREMQDILAYIAFISRGAPIGDKHLPGAEGIIPMKDTLIGDTARGRAVFAAKCTACHGPEGQGNPGFPPLWGARSYSIGASMAREERAASFIWHNMPFGQGKTLTTQEAFDVAAFINSHPRPDSPGKEQDWPTGGAPKDVPYDTRGHVAYRPPKTLIRRADPAAAIVPPPASVRKPARAAAARAN